MKTVEQIREVEVKCKKLLCEKLKGDDRLGISCPDSQYPEPVYLLIKSAKTQKTVAVEIDGADGTLRFWDYVDDCYENESGVWGKITDDGINKFISELYAVLDRAVDVEFYDKNGVTDDYYAGVSEEPLDETVAKAILKKHAAGIKFLYANIVDFYGEKQFVFDFKYNLIKK